MYMLTHQSLVFTSNSNLVNIQVPKMAVSEETGTEVARQVFSDVGVPQAALSVKVFPRQLYCQSACTSAQRAH